VCDSSAIRSRSRSSSITESLSSSRKMFRCARLLPLLLLVLVPPAVAATGDCAVVLWAVEEGCWWGDAASDGVIVVATPVVPYRRIELAGVLGLRDSRSTIGSALSLSPVL
jgi:hypothetical protein